VANEEQWAKAGSTAALPAPLETMSVWGGLIFALNPTSCRIH
jgi:hypothetical protein